MVTLLLLIALFSLLGGVGVSVLASIRASDGGLKIKPFAAISGIIVSGFFFTLYSGAYSVDAGSIGVIKRQGRVVGMLEPGLHFVNPLMSSVRPVAIQRRIIKANESAGSSDLQQVTIETTLGYHVDPKYADFILAQLNDDAEQRVIVPAMYEAMKAEVSQYEAQGLVKDREKVRAGIEERVRGRLAMQHIILEDMSITNFAFSKDYETAIESKQVAEQNAEKAKNTLAQAKIEAETVAATAKGAADARRAQAEGEAAAILVEAQAKAKAQELQKQSLTPELLELRRIEMWEKNWDGSVPQYVVGGASGFNMLMPAPKGKE